MAKHAIQPRALNPHKTVTGIKIERRETHDGPLCMVRFKIADGAGPGSIGVPLSVQNARILQRELDAFLGPFGVGNHKKRGRRAK